MERLVHNPNGDMDVEEIVEEVPDELRRILKLYGYFGRHGDIIDVQMGTWYPYDQAPVLNARRTITFADGFFCTFMQRRGVWDRDGRGGYRRLRGDATYEVRLRVRMPILDDPKEFFKEHIIMEDDDEEANFSVSYVTERNRVPDVDWPPERWRRN